MIAPYPEIYLDTCAIGYGASVSVAGESLEERHEIWCGAREALHHAALGYAASLGNLDAAERAELLALRRFRDGVLSLRGELANGTDGCGETIADASRHVIETIDALLMLEGLGTPP